MEAGRQEENISELVRSLLTRRGIISSEDVSAFLAPDYVAHTHDPFLLADMQKATDRVLAAMDTDERIAVYADFDCDGIPGASVLSDFFTKVGYVNFEVYLPHRDREGYGFHTDAIDILAAREVKLIITVDVGTVAHEGVAHANSKGIDVIVTDHHEIPTAVGGASALPDAFAILNPKRAPYPFSGLCGAAVAFKLVQATLAAGKKRGLENFKSIPDGWEKWLLDLVAIATIADMVPLVGENRALAFWGLMVLRKSQRPGIVALCNALRLKRAELTENDIGFSIAPRVNAASRMDEPDLALRLLTTRDVREAESLAAQLEELNASRKGIVAGIVKNARKRVKERYTENDHLVVLGDTAWKPALMGLAANSIMNDRGGIVCLWGRDANGNLKGSCRSDGKVGLPELFAAARESFIECGGHNASGGFSVSHEKAHSLSDDLAAALASIERVRGQKENREGEVLEDPVADYDAIITLCEISWPLLRDISRLAPYGIGNPKPVFKIAGAVVVSTKVFGKEKNHFEIVFAIPESDTSIRAFDFFRTAEDFSHTPIVNEEVTILATLERDSFRLPARLALRIVDVLPGESPVESVSPINTVAAAHDVIA
jgi:single-stranded-DNA-specific exonuclease